MNIIGKTVRMTEAYKKALCEANQGVSREHIEEFGDCIGVVEGYIDYGTCTGPEVDVRWQPSKLRYGYAVEDLEVIDAS